MQKIIVMCLCIMLLVGTANAITTEWNAPGPDPDNWNIPANWSLGLPTSGDKAKLTNSGVAECQVTTVGPTANAVDMGGDNVLRIMNGGDLSNAGWFAVGYSSNAHLIVEEGGVVNVGTHFWLATQAAADNCIVDINGGTINVNGNIGLGTINAADPGGIVYVNVNAGVLNLDRWSAPGSIQDGSVLDIRYGTVNITNDGDQSDEAQAYADVGKITAFGGTGTLNIVHVNGVTTITATGGMDPWPVNITVPTGDVELSWTNLDPNNPGDSVWVDVWFGTDPNKLNSLVYSKATTDPADGENVTSVTVNAPDNGTYYWQVDSYIWGDPALTVIEGNVWSFTASNDAPPENVYAGVDMMTWANQSVDLLGTYSDDGASTVDETWTSSDPNAVFSPSSDGGTTGNAAVATVTVDYAAGAVTLTFTVQDGLNPAVSDDMIVTVYANSCEAARVGAGRAADYPGDFNADCITDFTDLAEEIAAKWMDDYTLTGPVPVVP